MSSNEPVAATREPRMCLCACLCVCVTVHDLFRE